MVLWHRAACGLLIQSVSAKDGRLSLRESTFTERSYAERKSSISKSTARFRRFAKTASDLRDLVEY